GGSDTLTATTSAGLDVSFSSSSDSCTVSGSDITYDHARPCTVTASADGNDDYNAATSLDRTFDIAQGKPHLTITVPNKPLVGGTGTVSATSESDGAITFALGDTTSNQACTVAPDGTVVFRHAGTCVVVATQAESADYLKASATSSFGVGKGTPH